MGTRMMVVGVMVVGVMVTTGVFSSAVNRRGNRRIIECPAICEPNKCPNIGPIKISECPSPYVKTDHCGCCQRCDIAHKTTTVSPLKRDEVCEKVVCPKKQLCMLNIQGLPMCKCPTVDLCNEATGRKRNKVCGSDGSTYPSRCHVKVASCQSDKKIRVVSRGSCISRKANAADDLTFSSSNFGTKSSMAESKRSQLQEEKTASAQKTLSSAGFGKQDLIAADGGLAQEVSFLLLTQQQRQSRRDRRRERIRRRKSRDRVRDRRNRKKNNGRVKAEPKHKDRRNGQQ